MKAKLFKAFIIDQEDDLAKQLITSVSGLFGKIYANKDPDAAKAEIDSLRPDIIFVNLSLKQRSANLEFVEKLFANPELECLFFGYCDAANAEIIAHAIESGIDDVFSRPFDKDIISSKISRFILNDEAQKLTLQYVPLLNPIKASFKAKFEMTSVDENGITFKTEHFINKGTTFKARDPIINDIFDVPEIELMITKTWIGEGWNEYFSFAEVREAKDKTSASLRKFILEKIQ